MTTLIWQSIIMHRSTKYNDYIRFLEALDEPGHPRSTVIHHADWTDMDRPDIITVTIEPR